MSRPPGPHDAAPAALLYAMRRDPLGFFTKLATDYGDFVEFHFGVSSPYYLLNHPDYIKNVLVTQDRDFTKWFAVDRIREVLGEGLFVSEGVFHLHQRRLSQPAFHHQRIAGYANEMVKLAAQLRARWQHNAIVDVCQEMNWLTMMIAATTLFGANVESDAEEVREALSQILNQFERSMLPEADRADFESARDRLDATIYRIIRQRRASGEDRDDLLSMLLRAQDVKGAGMSDQQLRDEAMTIFLAGHETTANALAWTWYLLSQNPHCEKQLHDELEHVLNGRLPTFDDAAQLKYTGMVFAEALRLYPPLWAFGRRAIADCRIGGYFIAAGSIVIVSTYVTHRDARYFPNPSEFDPQRWTAEAKAALPKFAYFPFSAGSRACLGESFAWMEAILCMATLAQSYKLSLVPNHPIALQPQLTLRAKHGIKMRVAQRRISE